MKKILIVFLSLVLVAGAVYMLLPSSQDYERDASTRKTAHGDSVGKHDRTRDGRTEIL